jgi:hypothetical protein
MIGDVAVRMCEGPCGRLISVTARSGPPPSAVADPEHWAVEYLVCTTCWKSWCDRCHRSLGSACCPEDGTELQREAADGSDDHDGDTHDGDRPAWRSWFGFRR